MNMSKLLGKVIVMLMLLGSSIAAYAAPVNVNTADADTLAANIVGIGPKKAQAIINYRKQNGPFANVSDLLKVKGIGPKVIEKNKADIRFSDASLKKAPKPVAKN